MVALQRVSVMLTGLLAGLDATFLLPVNRGYKELSGIEYALAHRSVVRIAGPPAPFLGVSLLLIDALLLLKMRRAMDRAFAWTASSFLCVLTNAIITFAVNVPINHKFLDTPEQSFPDDWEKLRDRWANAHNARTAAQLLGFALLLVGLIEPRPSDTKTGLIRQLLEGKS